MTAATRQALIVLGMHRSGTSATSGVFARLGASEPATLMPPTDDNPTGYWESVPVMGFHDRLLTAAGSSWSDWHQIEPDWFESATAKRFGKDLAKVLAREFTDANMMLVKDPRMCRVLPLWRTVLDDLGIAPRIVLTLRDPGEVAASLAKRNHFNERRGLLLWLRHVLDAERDTRGLPRTFVHYDDLLNDWRREISRVTDDLEICWPQEPESRSESIDDLLQVALRHEHSNLPQTAPSGDALLDWVVRTRSSLDVLARNDGGRTRALEELDAIGSDFNRASAAFADAARNAIELATAASDEGLAERSADVATLTSHLEDLRTQLAMATQQVTDLEQQVSVGKRQWEHALDLEARHFDAQKLLDQQAQELATLTRRALDAEERAGKAKQRARHTAAKTARSKKASRETQRKLEKQVARCERRIHRLQGELEAIHRSRSWKVTAPLRAMTRPLRRLRTKHRTKG